ncbi:MAG: methylmalonyl Co-A mutase-associated GTPase MeaB [Acidobacteria bacterium]|nr:methylmalonyl Co-A mutase-associated GTPase MeaB [Acidobacteriota bacterium]
MSRPRLPVARLVDGVLGGNRAVLAQAITLVESQHPDDSEPAAAVLDAILPHAGRSRRVGITGVPGVGKSTFIDALGLYLVHERNEQVAVLSVDPSSPLSGGSILGDKTRMERLALLDTQAFIRPSPTRGVLGGVASRTREAILLCEAAGFGTVLVETVGVGQSETAVRSMTDFFLLLILPGAGDDLQGIKRGIIEMVDAIVVTKADGAMQPLAERARADYAAALHLFPDAEDGWAPPVLTCSALEGRGIDRVWDVIVEHRQQVEAAGQFAARRRRQALAWLHELLRAGLETAFRSDPATAARLAELERAVEAGETTATSAARELLE